MVNQTEFWRELRGPDHKYCQEPRVVPAFTIQALQENTQVLPPPSCDPYQQREPKTSTFLKYYERGMIPVTLDSDNNGALKLTWKKTLEELDYSYYLPLFFDGLTERERPYTTIVELGISDMLGGCNNRVLPCIPQLILPIKKALDTKIPEILCRTMRALQRLVRSGSCIGEALVPYFRQILPVFGLLKDKQINFGEAIDYSHMRGENVQDMIQDTLEILEQYGGEDAFINIKYVVPTYESCMKN